MNIWNSKCLISWYFTQCLYFFLVIVIFSSTFVNAKCSYSTLGWLPFFNIWFFYHKKHLHFRLLHFHKIFWWRIPQRGLFLSIPMCFKLEHRLHFVKENGSLLFTMCDSVIHSHFKFFFLSRYSIERMPDAYGAPKMWTPDQTKPSGCFVLTNEKLIQHSMDDSVISHHVCLKCEGEGCPSWWWNYPHERIGLVHEFPTLEIMCVCACVTLTVCVCVGVWLGGRAGAR